MSRRILEAKFPFLQDDAFLVAQVDTETGEQRLLMQKIDHATRQVEFEDAIVCIHVAVRDIPVDDLADAATSRGFGEDAIKIRSSEVLTEIYLSPAEKFLAFQSWVAGIAEAGLSAFKLQSDIEAEAKLVYPIASRLMAFAARLDPTLLHAHFTAVVRECQHEGVRHVASLVANLLPFAQYATDKKDTSLVQAILECELPLPAYLKLVNGITGHRAFFLREAAESPLFLGAVSEWGEQCGTDAALFECLRELSYVGESTALLEVISEYGVPRPPVYQGAPLFEAEYATLLALEELLDQPVPHVKSNKSNFGFVAEGGHVTTLALADQGVSLLPEAIRALAWLKVLALPGNQLAALPVATNTLVALEDLDLGDNQLATLPADLGALTSLKYLNLQKNQLATLPAEIGQLSSLIGLDLRCNNLATLPGAIGKLTSLIILELDHNQLPALPEEIGQLSSLKRLNLSHNLLAALPESITQLAELKWICLEENPLLHLPEALERWTADLKERGGSVYQ